MSKFRWILVLLTFCGMAVAQDDYTLWSSYKDIVLNTSASGANVSGNVTGFPVLIRLTSANADVFTQTLTGGADIRFAKPNGSHLPYQIERWDALNLAAEIWVLADTVYGNNSTQSIRMYWGKNGAADSSNGSAVFSNGYVGAWHLGNASGALPRPNALTGGFPATPINYPGNYVVPSGIIGMADSLMGGAAQTGAAPYLRVDSGTTTTAYNFPNIAFTYSVWAYPVSNNANARFLEMASDPAAGNDRIWLGWNGTANTLTFRYNIGNGTRVTASPTSTVSLNQWHHIVVTIGANTGGTIDTSKVYLDGALTASGTANSNTILLPNTARNFVFLGRDFESVNDSTFAGKLDEPEIANATRSPDWIRLSYQSQQATQTLVALGTSHANVTAPAIATNPATQSTTVGSQVLFRVVVTGTPPMTYKWIHTHGGTSDTTTHAASSNLADTLKIAVAAVSDTGSYKVIVSNSLSSATSAVAVLTVIPGPAITSQPTSVIASLGSAVKFFVVASGAPLTYKWIHIHGATTDTISGATTDTLKIAAVALADTGTYRVIVSNTAGSALSAGATLALLPTITTQPVNQIDTVGRSARFFVVATGTPPFAYKWIHIHGATTDTISGATADTLKIASAALSDTGTYKAIVKNSVGQVVSNGATLTVNPVSILPGKTPGSRMIRVSASSILFRIPEGNLGARIIVMDVWGRVIWSRGVEAGVREVTWDKSSSSGVIPGVYIVRLTVMDPNRNPQVAAQEKVFLNP